MTSTMCGARRSNVKERVSMVSDGVVSESRRAMSEA